MSQSNLTVTILGSGTSQGIPVIGCQCQVCTSSDKRDRRLRTSVAVASETTRVIIDIGPDFRQQLLRSGIANIDGVVLTHEHNDHVSGLDDIRPINFIQQKNIPVFGLPRVLNEVRMRFPYVFDEHSEYPGRPKVELVPLAQQTFAIGDIMFTPIRVMHGPLPILGFRVGNFCYITDAKTISDEEIDKLRGLEVLVINALHRLPHFSHLNLDEAVAMVERIGPARAYLTHMSHDMGLHAEVERDLPAHVRLAHDQMELSVS